MQRTISTSTHAFLDYLASVTLLGGPWIFGFQHEPMAKTISLLSGAAIAMVSFFTYFEGGVVRFLSMRVHLSLDALVGLSLIAVPMMFNFSDPGRSFIITMGTLNFAGAVSTWPSPPKDLVK
ncbi:hypothetical protein [Sphingobacterium sp.]|uniref:SPW repeat domain-containing protein n=1 Tax=Sphingobacterium sp. TaxID=341027 RepID=UPI0028A9D7F2|nr:hypothetical protein [Sphingobacterium sp.]